MNQPEATKLAESELPAGAIYWDALSSGEHRVRYRTPGGENFEFTGSELEIAEKFFVCLVHLRCYFANGSHAASA